MAKVLGIGGVFFKASDPDALKKWYIDTLGAPATKDPGISFPISDHPAGGYAVFGPFKSDTEYFNPSKRDYMFNLVVDDLDGVLQRVSDAGGTIVGDVEEYDFGRFGWAMDPEDNKIEFWQPPEDS